MSADHKTDFFSDNPRCKTCSSVICKNCLKMQNFDYKDLKIANFQFVHRNFIVTVRKLRTIKTCIQLQNKLTCSKNSNSKKIICCF